MTKLQAEVAAWQARLEAAEARAAALQAELSESREVRGLEVRLATLQAEKAATETLMERAERASAEQIKELRDANALATKRLQAAAKERQSILQQKEAACDSWHRASEALAGCQAEKRALETASVGQDKALASARARCAKLESELKEASLSAQQAMCKVEETVALQAKQLTAERAADMKAERERAKLAQALAGERERSQAFVESTFMQQQQLVEQQQQQLEQQRRLRRDRPPAVRNGAQPHGQRARARECGALGGGGGGGGGGAGVTRCC